jgi:hypothetical protein
MSDEPTAYISSKDLYTILNYKQTQFNSDSDDALKFKADDGKSYTREGEIKFGPISQHEYSKWNDKMSKKWKERVFTVAEKRVDDK